MQVFCAGVLLQSCVEKILDLRRRESSGYGGRPDGSPRGRVRCRAQQGARTSRAEMTPRRMTMRHGGGTEHERGVFRAKCARERVSARPSVVSAIGRARSNVTRGYMPRRCRSGTVRRMHRPGAILRQNALEAEMRRGRGKGYLKSFPSPLLISRSSLPPGCRERSIFFNFFPISR